MFKLFRRSEPAKVETASSYSVLIISDDLITHSLVSETLLQNQYQVHTASTVDSALELLKQIGTPALMIGDFAHPEVEGVKFLKRAQTRLGKSTFPPVLFLVDAKDDENAARMVGAQELLGKPVDPTALVACVSKLIANGKAVVAH